MTIVSGLYAVLSQEVESVRRELSQQIGNNKEMLSEHLHLPGHAAALVEIAELRQRFVEVETQLRAARDRLASGDAQLHDLMQRAEKRLEERTGMLDARIQREVQLERERLQIQIDMLKEQIKAITTIEPKGGIGFPPYAP